MRLIHPSERVGTRVAGKYQIVRIIGEGGMGAVYEARHVQMDRRVAIKMLRAEFVRDHGAVAAAFDAARPQLVFHLAAQPLVRRSYLQPQQTFATNVMGTVNILESVRTSDSPCAAVIVTAHMLSRLH